MSHFIDEDVDYSKFDTNYNNDETGAPAIHPRIMLKIILYGYSLGQISSRKLQRLCQDNMVMKALAEGMEPFHTTIARFIVKNGEQVKKIFTEALYFCNEQDLIGGKMFAIDGCRLPSNASKEWSGTKKELKKKRDKIATLVERLIKQHKDEDNKKGGSKRGDDSEKKYQEQIKRYRKQIAKLDKFDKESWTWPQLVDNQSSYFPQPYRIRRKIVK
jgi:transposase